MSAAVHLVSKEVTHPSNTLCGILTRGIHDKNLTHDPAKATCLHCLRTKIVRDTLEADKERQEWNAERAATAQALQHKNKRIDTLEKGIDVLLDKCLEGRQDKSDKPPEQARTDKPKTGRMELPDGTVRLIGVSAAARWLGCKASSLSQIAKGKSFYSGTLEQRARVEFPKLFAS